MPDWNYVRAQFPAAERFAYLDSAAAGLVSKRVAQRGQLYYDEILSGKPNWEKWLTLIEKARQSVARLINADKDEIAFVPNTSHGMSIIAEMLGNHGKVVTMEDEFPSSTIPWLNRGFDMIFVKPENTGYHLSCIEKQMGNAKILVTSHVQFSTGFRQDLVELGKFCRDKGLIHVVNATQSAGAVPIDVKKANVDFLVFSGIKWMCAGEGLGAVYISKRWQNGRKWPITGWMSAKDPMALDNKRMDPKDGASVLEAGGPLLPNIFVLGRAVGLIAWVGVPNIERRIRELSDLLIKKLQELNVELLSPVEWEHRTGIVVIKTKNPERIAKRLGNRGVIVSARKISSSEEVGLRVSVHMYNNEADIDRFVSEFKKLI